MYVDLGFITTTGMILGSNLVGEGQYYPTDFWMAKALVYLTWTLYSKIMVL